MRVDDALDEYDLEHLGQDHGIAANLFVPFAAVRLREPADGNQTILNIRLRDIREPGEVSRRVRLFWSVRSFLVQPAGVQDHTVTEWAALAVACAVVLVYAGLRVSAVAARGDRFDFWVSDGEQEYGLEVSGTMTGDVEGRHRNKIRQLRANPYAVDGYAVTVDFATRTALFSFHSVAEELP